MLGHAEIFGRKIALTIFKPNNFFICFSSLMTNDKRPLVIFFDLFQKNLNSYEFSDIFSLTISVYIDSG